MNNSGDIPVLPKREAQVLAYVADGLTNEQIASILGTSTRTVGNQLASTYLRLGVENRVQAARWFWEHQGAERGVVLHGDHTWEWSDGERGAA